MAVSVYRRWKPSHRAEVGQLLRNAKCREEEEEICERFALSRHDLHYYRAAPLPPPGRLRLRSSTRPDLNDFLLNLIHKGARLSFANCFLLANIYASVCSQRVVSKSWVSRFVARERMRSVVPHGERAASNVQSARVFVEAFSDVRRLAHPTLFTPSPPQPTVPTPSRTRSSRIAMKRPSITSAPPPPS